MIAVTLALFGQCVAAFGFPVPEITKSNGHRSACGCSPEDRAAGRCCCHRAAGASCCEDPPEPDLPPCCRARAAKEKQQRLAIHWQPPALQQQCKGPSDPVTASWQSPSIPPAPTMTLPTQSPVVGIAPVVNTVRLTRSSPPDDPPPRFPVRSV